MLVIIIKFISWAMDFEKILSLWDISPRAASQLFGSLPRPPMWTWINKDDNISEGLPMWATYMFWQAVSIFFSRFGGVGMGRKGEVGRMKRTSRKEGCHHTWSPNSSLRLVNRYSYPYAALQFSHTTWYGLRVIQLWTSSKIPLRHSPWQDV